MLVLHVKMAEVVRTHPGVSLVHVNKDLKANYVNTMWMSALRTRVKTGGLVSTRSEDSAVNVDKDLKELSAMKT